MRLRPLHLVDGYKIDHRSQYPDGTTLVYSNFTARYSRVPESKGLTLFGLQYYIKEYLQDLWDEQFFWEDLDVILKEYKRRINCYLGPDAITFDHIEALWKLGYLPLCIKSLPEGVTVPYGVPAFTIRNTHKDFFWLTNMLETNMSNILWQPMTSASTAREYRAAFRRYGVPDAIAQFLGHDFSYRGLPGTEAAMLSGAAHLIFFAGTDTVPALDLIEDYYEFDVEKGLLGVSVPATEHSVMSMGLQEGEMETFRRLMRVYPKGFLSVVSDTWDLWKVIGDYLPTMKAEIMGRDGRLVIRPDSGDPVKILCGDYDTMVNRASLQGKGVVECLWDIFGGTVNDEGLKVLDTHIGVIYGDSITRARQDEIAERLIAKGFAPWVVLGIGSYTYQMVTRDTHGIAMKATYGEINGKGQAIFKKPATDDGSKNSAKGLLQVVMGADGIYQLKQDVSWREESEGALVTRFLDGSAVNELTFQQIRENAGATFV